MKRCIFSDIEKLWSKYAVHAVLLVWSVGFAAGLICIHCAFDYYAVSIQSVAELDATFLGLLLTGATPLLLSYIVFRLSVAPLVLLPVFTKAFGFAFCSFWILWSYGSAGWLFRALLLVSDSAWVVILIFFCIRYINGDRKTMSRHLVVCLATAVAVVMVDYLYVVPLLHSLV